MTASISPRGAAGAVLSALAGALVPVTIVLWVLSGFDTPPSPGMEMFLTQFLPAGLAVITFYGGAVLLGMEHPKTWGRRLIGWMFAGFGLLVAVNAVLIASW